MNFWDMMATAIEKGDSALLANLGEQDELRKSAVTAAGIGIGGALTPAASRQYFTTMVDQSSFLGRVASTQVDALEQDVDLFDVSARSLQRVAEGTEPTTITGATNLGKRWAMKDVQLFPTINFSTIVQRQKQGNIEAYLAALFTKAFRNDLLLLGLEGDEALTGDDFKKLNDGWPTLAKVAAGANSRALTNVDAAVTTVRHGSVTGGPFQVAETITGGTSTATGTVSYVGSGWVELTAVSGTFVAGETLTGGTSLATATSVSVTERDLDHMATMDNLIEAMDDRYLVEGQTAFLMSRKDAIAWGGQMAKHEGLNPYLITGQVPQYKGFEVVGIPGFPQSEFMLTNPANLGFGMGTTIQRWRELIARKRCIEYTWNLYSDYIIVNDLAVAYSEPA